MCGSAKEKKKMCNRQKQRFANIPDLNCAIARSGGEDIGVTRAPNGGIDVLSVFLEGADAGGTIEGPELDGAVPGGGDKGVSPDRIVVDRVNLVRMFAEGADRVLGWGKCEVVEFDGAVGDCSDDDGVVRLGPGDVIDAVGGIVGDELNNREGRIQRIAGLVRVLVARNLSFCSSESGFLFVEIWVIHMYCFIHRFLGSALYPQ